MQSTMDWQDNADASGFVLRDGITAVGTVLGGLMGDHEPTL
jgi:hypothetical protein